MNSNAFWAIVSLVGSFIIGYFFYRLGKIKKYPLKLSFCIPARFKVHQQVPEHLSELSSKINGHVNIQRLHYFEIMLYNIKTSDVQAFDLNSPISLILPNTAKWLAVQIKDESPNVNSSVEINAKNRSQACLLFKLLKDKEYIIIECLVESTSDISGYKDCNLLIEHRIPNLDKIRFVPCYSESAYKLQKKLFWRHLSFIGADVLGLVATTLHLSTTDFSFYVFIGLLPLLCYLLFHDIKVITTYFIPERLIEKRQ